MQLWINPMSLDRNPNEFARSDLNRRSARVARCHLGNLLGMAVNNRCHQHLLAREVRVQRTDADPATSPILLVLALSYLRIRQKRTLASAGPRSQSAHERCSLEFAILGVVAGDHVRGRISVPPNARLVMGGRLHLARTSY
jgi:hypothetical protein